MKNVVHQATVKLQGREDEKYVGLTARPFKTGNGEHKGDFEHFDRKGKTKLAAHMWKLKDEGKTPDDLTWNVVCRAAPFNPTTRICNLWTAKKWNIIFKPKSATLISRQELYSHCRHMGSSLLVKKKRKTKVNSKLKIYETN